MEIENAPTKNDRFKPLIQTLINNLIHFRNHFSLLQTDQEVYNTIEKLIKTWKDDKGGEAFTINEIVSPTLEMFLSILDFDKIKNKPYCQLAAKCPAQPVDLTYVLQAHKTSMRRDFSKLSLAAKWFTCWDSEWHKVELHTQYTNNGCFASILDWKSGPKSLGEDDQTTTGLSYPSMFIILRFALIKQKNPNQYEALMKKRRTLVYAHGDPQTKELSDKDIYPSVYHYYELPKSIQKATALQQETQLN